MQNSDQISNHPTDSHSESDVKITQYCELLLKWQKHINLIGSQTVADLRARHIQDSLQIIPHIKQGVRVIDLGSGAGLPGVVVAIERPDLAVTCIDSDQKKIAFINEVKARVGITNVHPLCTSWDNVRPDYDVAVSRAAAKLTTLLGVMSRCLADSKGIGVIHKGATWEKEIADAQQTWSFTYTAHTSATSPDSAVLTISNLRPRES